MNAYALAPQLPRNLRLDLLRNRRSLSTLSFSPLIEFSG